MIFDLLLASIVPMGLLTFDFHCLLIPVQSLHVNLEGWKSWSFFDFLIQLIFTMDLQMYQLIRVRQPIHGLMQSMLIWSDHLIEVCVLIWQRIHGVYDPDVATDVQIVWLLLPYFFQVVASVLYLSFVILIYVVLTLNSIQYFPDDLRLPLRPTWVILGDVHQFFDRVFRQWIVSIFAVVDWLLIDYHSWFAKYLGMLFEFGAELVHQLVVFIWMDDS